MLEKEIESKLTKPIRNLGGMCRKFESPGFTGVPDRLILLPGGHVIFVETKRPGRTERPRQKLVQAQLRAMGFTVFSSVDSVDKLDAVVKVCREAVYGEDV